MIWRILLKYPIHHFKKSIKKVLTAFLRDPTFGRSLFYCPVFHVLALFALGQVCRDKEKSRWLVSAFLFHFDFLIFTYSNSI